MALNRGELENRVIELMPDRCSQCPRVSSSVEGHMESTKRFSKWASNGRLVKPVGKFLLAVSDHSFLSESKRYSEAAELFCPGAKIAVTENKASEDSDDGIYLSAECQLGEISDLDLVTLAEERV